MRSTIEAVVDSGDMRRVVQVSDLRYAIRMPFYEGVKYDSGRKEWYHAFGATEYHYSGESDERGRPVYS
jgi:hypothetical protein